ncbi:MAG: tetratricopeptide repeat protein, partial [Bacillota bacterium]
NAKQAYTELEPLQRDLGGTPEFDYLFGMAALDSGRIEDAIIAFERVLALMPQHAGAQMDLARAYYAAGSYDLAEAAFVKLRESNPPAPTLAAINRYLDAIRNRRHEAQAGWSGFGELAVGYDSNITGVPSDFGAAVDRTFGIPGIQPTGNSIKRAAGFVQAAAGADYHTPLSAGWSAFGGGSLRGRAYKDESDFDLADGEVRVGAQRNLGTDQWRGVASYLPFSQKGAAPGDPQPTNDRRVASLGLDWRRALDSKTQVGASLQFNAVRFPDNRVEDFDQVLVALSWLHSFDRQGAPLVYVSAFASDDHAKNDLGDGVTKSKNIGGVRSYVQYSLSPKLQAFAGLSGIARRDKDLGARGLPDQRGRDLYGEANLGLAWQFREPCTARIQYLYSRNNSNIDIYDFNRYEILTAIRCDL